jgi:hypothetical protein
MGNPTFVPAGAAAPGAAPVAKPPPPTSPAPAARPALALPASFVRATSPAKAQSAGSAVAVAPPPAVTTRTASTEVGQMLSTVDIHTILSHAGSGCPLGPCKGCPQHEVRTGACMA